MPLEQRVIEPICVSRGCVPMDSSGNLAINIPNELECVTNGSLANIIRQLSSLSRYAEDLFGGILTDASLLIVRATSLQTRIDRLANKVISLDSSVEEVSLQDIHLRKAFKSSTVFDQQVVARDTIPEAIKDVYKECDKPPPLQKLNPYRDDGKDGLKFYTDPNYFFELWRQEMLADEEKFLADKVKKVPKNKPGSDGKKQRKVRQPANSRERYRQMMANQGEFIIETKSNGQPMGAPSENLIYIDTNGSIVDPTNYNLMQSQARPNSLELTQVTYQQYLDMNALAHNNHINNHNNGVQHNHNSSNHLQYTNQMMASQHGPPPAYYQQQQQQYQQQQQLQHHKYQQEVIQQNHYNAQHVNYHSHQDQNIITGPQSQQQSTPTRRQASITSRPSQPPPAPPSGSGSAPSSGPSTPSHTMSRDSNNHENVGTPNHSRSRTRDTLPPPPPPPPTQQDLNNTMNGQQEPNFVHNSKQSPVNHVNNIPEQVKMEPPPPPPPPPSGIGLGIVNDTTDSHRSTLSKPTIKDLQSIQLKKTPVNQPVVQSDARSDLLAAIREGIKLKRVEDCKQREVEKSTPLHDVASILARRVAIELSDSEGGADDDCDDDSDGWDDESEC